MKKEEKIEVIKVVLKYYFLTRCVLLFLILIIGMVLPYTPSNFNKVSDLFDNQYYLSIAFNGYISNDQYAFFPFVPLIIRYLGKCGFIVLNQVLVLLSGYLIYYIDNIIFKNKNNNIPLLFWMISPISVFTCMYYTEGVFMFLTIFSYYLYKRKNNYFILGIVLGLAVFTRSIGSMLFFAIFILMLIGVFKNKEKLKNIFITFIPATIISSLYPIYLYYKTGNYLYFVDIQSYWLKVPSNIFIVFFDAFKYLNFSFSNFNVLFIFNYLIILFLFIYICYLLIENRKNKKYYDMILYLILSLISICSVIKGNNDPLASYYRYVFGCFPLYFILDRNRYVILFLILFTMFVSILFLSGVYFF